MASAVIAYNEGISAIAGVFRELGMEVGGYTQAFYAKMDYNRVNKMEKKTSQAGKLRRKKLRAVRKGLMDKTQLAEGETYAPGAFS